MPALDLPRPNDRILNRTVVASVWFRDDADKPALATVLLLNREPPYFRVAGLIERNGEWAAEYHYDHMNIVSAIVSTDGTSYIENGGDY